MFYKVYYKTIEFVGLTGHFIAFNKISSAYSESLILLKNVVKRNLKVEGKPDAKKQEKLWMLFMGRCKKFKVYKSWKTFYFFYELKIFFYDMKIVKRNENKIVINNYSEMLTLSLTTRLL